MGNIGFVLYGFGALAFATLSGLLLTAWRGRFQGALLVAASAISALWCLLLGYNADAESVYTPLIVGAEIVRDVTWFAFIISLQAGGSQTQGQDYRQTHIWVWIGAVTLGLAFFAFFAGHLPSAVVSPESASKALVFGTLLLAITGLALVEQLYRNTRQEHRWAIKFLCFGVGGLFVFDFFLYSHALLLNNIATEMWVARGLINALAVPLIAVSAARNPDWSLQIFVSRQAVFHTAAVFGAGCYLLVMSAAGYYIRVFGGSWGTFGQVVFISGAVLVLFLMMFSGQLRARAQLFLSKHFFRNKYDYREEWLKFTEVLSTGGQQGEVFRESVIHAIANIVDSPGGIMWGPAPSRRIEPVASWQCAIPPQAAKQNTASMVRFMESTGSVIFIDDYLQDNSHYDGLQLPQWLAQQQPAWVIVPLRHSAELFGFIVLTRPAVRSRLNWEDSDLLKTVGRQAASYLALFGANEALYEARQFEAFNRLSSYVVHDLKNVAAQLALVSRNAQKHLDNPAFVEDAMNTVENATTRMNRLLEQLRKDRLEESSTKLVNVRPLLEKAVAVRAVDNPQPELKILEEGLITEVDPERLIAVLQHLIQNAQEATPDDGKVVVRADRTAESIVVEVEDSGCGMDQVFIAERLFRPFDTTKGNAGMGIGVYETREFVASCDGEMEVSSVPGAGTKFVLRFPTTAQILPSLPAAAEA